MPTSTRPRRASARWFWRSTSSPAGWPICSVRWRSRGTQAFFRNPASASRRPRARSPRSLCSSCGGPTRCRRRVSKTCYSNHRHRRLAAQQAVQVTPAPIALRLGKPTAVAVGGVARCQLCSCQYVDPTSSNGSGPTGRRGEQESFAGQQPVRRAQVTGHRGTASIRPIAPPKTGSGVGRRSAAEPDRLQTVCSRQESNSVALRIATLSECSSEFCRGGELLPAALRNVASHW